MSGIEISGGSPKEAIEYENLDHLALTACADITDLVDMTAEVADNTILANILTNDGNTSDYDRRIHSLEALYNALVGSVDAVNRAIGREQVKAATINLAQAAASYTLFTGTAQDVVIESLTFRLPAVNVSDDVTITSISIQTNDATPQVFISSATGVKANLASEAQIGWVGTSLLKAGKLIQLTIAGGAADAATTCDVIAKYHTVVAGGYLA